MNTLERFVTAGCVGASIALFMGDVRSAPVGKTVPIDCRVSGSNDGCETTVSCPQGMRIRGATAACNLEFGAVTDQQLSKLPDDVVAVLRSSDHVEEGRCWVGATSLDEGQASVTGIEDQSSVDLGCQEHDKNGGDCQIRGLLRCE